jgi:hypothetical protein
MKQFFEDFKQQYPKVAKAMGVLGMAYEEYCDAYRRGSLRWIYDPPRVSMSNATTLLPRSEQIWYTNSTNTKE